MSDQQAENRLRPLRILVLVDGFDTERLVRSLEHQVQLHDAELLLLFVRGPAHRAGLEVAPRRPGGHRLPADRERALAEAELDEGAQALAEAEQLASQVAGQVQSRQLEGEPGHVVCDLARTESVDLVVLRGASRGQPPEGHAHLGPTARYVVDHSPCPVLLLPTGR
jgi:nucleotide-binding universal stress UspA family protein